MKDLHKLTPFKYFVLTNFPYIEADFDAITNYELFCKVAEYLNNISSSQNDVIDDFNELYGDWGTYSENLTGEWDTYKHDLNEDWNTYKLDLNEDWNYYKNYIVNYFTNLNVQTEINTKLDEMADAGFFNDLIASDYSAEFFTEVGNIVSSWISENLLQETGYVIDNSLTVENAAADAKSVGDALKYKADIIDIWSNNLWNGHYSGGFINESTGEWNATSSPTSTYCGTEEFIPVQAPFILVFHNYLGASNITVRYAIYDENKQFLSGDLVSTSDYTLNQDITASYLVFTNPNAKYIRFSALRAVFTSGYYLIEIQRGTQPNMYSEYVDGKVVDITEMSQLVKSNIIGYRPTQIKHNSTFATEVVRLPINFSVKKNKVYHFFVNIAENFTSMQCGHGMENYSLYFEIDNTNIKFLTNGVVGTSIPHGLTLNTYIDLLLIVGEENTGTIILNTLGGQYKNTVQVVNGYKGMLFVKNIGSSLTNVSITFACEDFRQPIWMFGDSYFTHTSNQRWPYHLIKWGFGRCLLDGFPGEVSASAFNQFVDYVNMYGCPKYAVWCMGMNDADDSAVNANWLTYVQMFIDICEANQIEPILATIPNTPTVTNYYKNEWVKNSGYRYIDFAKAVNAESIGATWYDDTREDNTHPNEQGAKLLALQVLKDLPEIMLGNI